MTVVLYPRAAPADRIRIWIGAFEATAAPTLKWFLDDQPANPGALRQIASVRPDEMLPPGSAPATLARAFTGVYEFGGLTADTAYAVAVEAGDERVAIETRTLPDAVPAQLDRSLNVLLISCFHAAEDPGGLAGTIVSQLGATVRPHLTLLAGDQVYLDLPTLQDFRDDVSWLADKFESDYRRNWLLGYGSVLAAAPSLSVPDDHEYWNNYPHPSPFIGNSLTPDSRSRWRAAAQATYRGFQLGYPDELGDRATLDIDPLSLFLADTRSNKDIDRQFTMTERAHQQLDDWVTHVIDRNLFGVFLSGQSLFSSSAGEFSGSVGDFELANYGDYGRLMASLQRLVDAGRPVLCLTGDVHWGRVATTIDLRTGRIGFAEVISSPASLVATVGVDQAKEAGAAIGNVFGSHDPWPRHSNPEDPPMFLARSIFDKRFTRLKFQGQRGNHVALLSFRRNGTGLELTVTYWPIHTDPNVRRPVEVEPIKLVTA